MLNIYLPTHAINKLAEHCGHGDMVKKMEWINVKDRLPENDDEVLIGSFYKDSEPGYRHVARHSNGEWQVQFGTYSLKNSVSIYINFNYFEDGEWYITHWMPLPDPPND